MILNKIRDQINNEYQREIKAFYAAENKAAGISCPYSGQSGFDYNHRQQLQTFQNDLGSIANRYSLVYGETFRKEMYQKVTDYFKDLLKIK
jgi:hypothetical protein